MRPRATPALAQALEFIESLRLAGATSGGRLPTVRRLAGQAGVSLRTMHQAVRLLVRAGLLFARQRAGIHWAEVTRQAPRLSPGPAPELRAGRPERLALEIEGAVLSGALPDPLPSVKELRGRYRAGHAAVSRALSGLAGRGTLVRRGRQWVVARTESRSGASAVVLVGPADTMAGYASFDSKAAEYCTALERECAMRATAIRFQSSFRPVRPDSSALGHLVAASHEPENTGAILGALQPGGRPAVVVDILGDCPLPRLAGLGHVLAVRVQGARFAGRQVAMMLRGLGHRRIAYLSPYTLEGTTWVGDRLAGLREVYGDNAVAFLGEELHSGGTANELIDTRVLPSVSSAVSSIARGVSRHLGPTGSSWVSSQLLPPLRNRLIERNLEPLFQNALRDRSISAWVGANDDVALSALTFLASHRVHVPGLLSVVGFDGSPRALLAELATYDFNAPAAARTALDLVLRPPPKLSRPGRRILDIPGVLAQRPTVAPTKL